MKIILILICLLVYSFANTNDPYTKLFIYLESKGVVLEEDIGLFELYKMKESGKLYLPSGEINTKELDKKIEISFKKRELNNQLENNISTRIQKEVDTQELNDFSNKKDYSKLFYYMKQEGVALEKDISLEQLFKLSETGDLFYENGKINLKVLNKKIGSLVKYKEEQSRILDQRLQNTNSEINKTVKEYIDSNNEAITQAQENIKKNSKDEDNWFVKVINSILEMLKH